MPIIPLEAIGDKKDIPSFITQEYLDLSALDEELQKNWKPKVGDWYCCKDLWKILQIKSLRGYYSEGDPRMKLSSDSGKDAKGHWECDIYIPEPKQ